MKSLLSTTLLLTLLIVQPVNAAEKVSKAQALIQRAVKAIGGKKAVLKTANTIVSDKGTYYGMGMALPYTGRIVTAIAKDGSVRTKMEIAMAFVVVVNKDKAWRSAGGQTQAITGKGLEVAMQQAKIANVVTLIPLLKPSKAYKLTLLKPAKVNGVDCAGVKVSHKGMPDVTFHFSKKTGLVRKIAYKLRAEELGFQEVLEESVLDNYKKIEGVQTATKSTISRDGKKFVVSTPTKISYPKSIKDDEFKKP